MKLKASIETDIYICESGYIALKQSDPMEQDPTIVLLSPEQAKLVVKEIGRLLKDKANWWNPEDEETPA